MRKMIITTAITIMSITCMTNHNSNVSHFKNHYTKTIDGYNDEFSKALSFKESSYNQFAKNGSFFGLFQFGKPAIIEIVKRDSSFQDVLDNWDSITSSEKAAKKYFPRYRQMAAFEVHKRSILRMLGKTEGVGNGAYELAKEKGISEAGMIAATHLVGPRGFKNWLNGADVRDGNGTSPYVYIQMFGNKEVNI